MAQSSIRAPDSSFHSIPTLPYIKTVPKMSAAVAGQSLPKIAPPSTPIHLQKMPTIPFNKAPTVIIENSSNRNRSAPAAVSKTILTSSDYGSHTYVYDNTPNYGVYPPFVTERQTGVKIPPRVNPLQPPPPDRYTTSLETVEPHWHNEKRRGIMQQKEWYRYHGTWSKAFYGSAAEKEAYRKSTRDTLKQQMDDYWARKKRAWEMGSQESQASIHYDRQCVEEDALDYKRKHVYLTQYRDDNKKLMEQTWARKEFQKRINQEKENELLRYTPINWSHTLK